jgi:threonine synthase
VAVSEAEIVRGTQELHRKGILVEPTSAVVIPGLQQLQADGVVHPDEQVVAVLTGSALKAVPELREIHRRNGSVSPGSSRSIS